MKKAICFLCFLTILISFLCACKNNNKETSDNSISSKTSVNLDSEYELGEEAETTVFENEDEQQVVHIDEFGEDIKIEHCNPNGAVIYIEEPVYNEKGEIKGYKYYNANNDLFACLDMYQSFYDKDGNFITESEFEQMINELK